MRKMTKSQRINQIADQLARQQGVISKLTIAVKEQNEAILMLEKLTDEKLRDQPEPQLKQLDQSVFDGLDEKWRFAAVDKGGAVWVYSGKPDRDCGYWFVKEPVGMSIGKGYDASNWQNSLIERDIAKELTGSELCKAMLARGDKYVMCLVSGMSDTKADSIPKTITSFNLLTGQFRANHDRWKYAVPINNQGEPLTASEVGL